MAKAKKSPGGKKTPGTKKSPGEKKTPGAKKQLHDDQEQLQAWERDEHIGATDDGLSIQCAPDESE